MAKVAFAPNKDLYREIQNSKLSYCYFIDQKYTEHDIIVDDLSEVTLATAKTLRDKKIHKTLTQSQRRSVALGTLVIGDDFIPLDTIVFRVMTSEHIPLRGDSERKSKNLYTETSFEPFKHFIFEDGCIKEVLRSHWVNGFDNGSFSDGHGKLSNELVRLLMLMITKFSYKGNWRMYSYVDEMVLSSMEHVIANKKVLKFRDTEDNPFAYITTLISNCFRRVWNTEKGHQDVRDDLLQSYGLSASHTRMGRDID